MMAPWSTEYGLLEEVVGTTRQEGTPKIAPCDDPRSLRACFLQHSCQLFVLTLAPLTLERGFQQLGSPEFDSAPHLHVAKVLAYHSHAHVSTYHLITVHACCIDALVRIPTQLQKYES